jgi:hypothetical protein
MTAATGSSAPAPPAPPPAAPLAQGEACGALQCLRFADAAAALRYVMREQPLIIGLGEAHTPAGSAHLATTAARFSELLLPILAENASHLIVELLRPNPACQEAARPLQEAQKPVVTPQAPSNQNDYVALGVRARSLGVEPFLLTPTCREFEVIAAAGEDAIPQTLTAIASITTRLAKGALVQNHKAGSSRVVLAYGGALHNDLSPSPTRASFRYGDVLQDFSGGRYVALDLIVRELIKDNDAWRALPWYAEFDRELHPESYLLLQPAPHSYVLFFPRSPPADVR